MEFLPNWEPGELIALVAIVVSATVAIVSPLLAGVVQKQRDRDRFDHERAQNSRTDAATAYGKVRHLLRYVHPSRTAVLVDNGDAELRLREEIDDALSMLGIITALGWTSEVRTATARCAETFESLVMTNWAFLGALRNNNQGTTFEQVETKWDTAWETLGHFRRTITGDEEDQPENAVPDPNE